MTDSLRAKFYSRKLWLLFIPLALSWLLMSMEGPVATAILSALPLADLMQAAFVPLFAICLFIESPAIDMLSTGTALVKGPNSYRSVRTFCLWLLGIATFFHALFAFTPFFTFVTRDLLHLKPELIVHMKAPAICFLTWTAAVGWRRLHQGILIQAGNTKPITHATIARLATMVVSGILIARIPDMTGIFAVCAGINLSVAVEAAYIYGVARKHLQSAEFLGRDDAPIRTKEIAAFHIPLTLSTMVMFAGLPLLASAFSRSENPIINLAAWGVASNLMWLTKAPSNALPEVIIRSFADCPRPAITRFVTQVAALGVGVAILVAFSGFDRYYMEKLMGRSKEVSDIGHLILVSTALLPLVATFTNYTRGLLTAVRVTQVRTLSVLVSMAVMIVVIEVGVSQRASGVAIAVAALTASQVVDFIVLGVAWMRIRNRPTVGTYSEAG